VPVAHNGNVCRTRAVNAPASPCWRYLAGIDEDIDRPVAGIR